MDRGINRKFLQSLSTENFLFSELNIDLVFLNKVFNVNVLKQSLTLFKNI